MDWFRATFNHTDWMMETTPEQTGDQQQDCRPKVSFTNILEQGKIATSSLYTLGQYQRGTISQTTTVVPQPY